MHPSALRFGELFFETYCAGRPTGTLLDVGSQDVNGSLRSVKPQGWNYIGVDFAEGKGVDVIMQDPYALPFADDSADAIVCTSVFEHSDFFWLLFLEVLRVLKPDGFLYLNVPSNGYIHRYPIDSWRFYPDSGKSLVAWAEHNQKTAFLFESFIGAQGQGDEGRWNDFVAVFGKRLPAPNRPLILDRIHDYSNAWRHDRTDLQRGKFLSQDFELTTERDEQLHALRGEFDRERIAMRAQHEHLIDENKILNHTTTSLREELERATSAFNQERASKEDLRTQLESKIEEARSDRAAALNDQDVLRKTAETWQHRYALEAQKLRLAQFRIDSLHRQYLQTSFGTRVRQLLMTPPLCVPILPVANVEEAVGAPGHWRAIDNDPQFEIGAISQFSGRWVRLSIDIALDGHWASYPELFFDCGSGYSQSNSITLPQPSPGQQRITHIFPLPNELKSVRLDPIAEQANFFIGAVFVQPLSKAHALIAMARAIKRKHGSRRLLGIARRSLLPTPTPERLRRFALRIVENYRALDNDQASKSYHTWIASFEPAQNTYPALAAEQAQWSKKPTFSVVMPVYNTPRRVLREAIESVLAQIYPHWELCIANDASTKSHVRQILQEYSERDSRIKVIHRKSNGHIVAASNSALKELATGEFVALLDHDDLLHPLALHFVAEAINRNPDAGLIYSDEDKIDVNGRRYDPHFKCNFNYELLLSQNMICHLGVYRRSILNEIGGFVPGYEGSQDHDLALRAIEHLTPSQIVHVPRVLYHWRAITGSTAMAASEKPYAAIAARKAIADHLARRGISAEVIPAPQAPSLVRVRFTIPEPQPLVSIIIPTRDRADLLGMCLDSLLAKTGYQNYEIIVIDNGSVEPATHALLARMPKDRVRVLRDASPFNYSALNNRAVEQAKGDFVCLMNNDIEITDGDWLREMVSFAIQPGVGAVGARLWYPDGRLQHGGVILGIGGVAGHAHKFLEHNQCGYFCRAVLHQAFSAVTAACLVIRKSIYQDVGGLDEKLEIAFNDVDFCLRVREAGYRNVWTPYAELVHHESATRGHETTPEKQQRFGREIGLMESRWGDILREDPAYSPNLSLHSEDFSLAWPPRRTH